MPSFDAANTRMHGLHATRLRFFAMPPRQYFISADASMRSATQLPRQSRHDDSHMITILRRVYKDAIIGHALRPRKS